MKKDFKDLPESVQAYIKAAVNAGIEAGKQSASSNEKTAYQKTERRLYALPALIKKVEMDRDELIRLKSNERLPDRNSHDLIRFQRGGSRISAEEKLEAVINDLTARIAADEYEIGMVKKALAHIENEYYYPVIVGKYFEKRKDDDLAQELHCDERTIRRHRNRLALELSVLLYGSEVNR